MGYFIQFLEAIVWSFRCMPKSEGRIKEDKSLSLIWVDASHKNTLETSFLFFFLEELVRFDKRSRLKTPTILSFLFAAERNGEKNKNL